MTTLNHGTRGTRGEGKGERLEARVSKGHKELFQRAADLEGVTLSDYIISAMMDRARSTIREHEVIVLTGRNREAFLEALSNPAPVSPKLAAAFRKLRSLQDAQKQPAKRQASRIVERKAQSRGVQQRKRTA